MDLVLIGIERTDVMQNILVHGLGQDSSSWDETISYLISKDNVASPNLSLFIKDGDASYATLYKSFSEYCNTHSKPLNLCGLSLGAVLALNYAIDYPEKVESLILIAPQYKMPKTLLKLQNIIFRCMPSICFKSIGMKKSDFIQLTNSMMDLNFSDGLKNISCPVLILCGDKDGVNKKASSTLNHEIKQSKIEFISHAGHEVNMDEPKALAQMINEFYHKAE